METLQCLSWRLAGARGENIVGGKRRVLAWHTDSPKWDPTVPKCCPIWRQGTRCECVSSPHCSFASLQQSKRFSLINTVQRVAMQEGGKNTPQQHPVTHQVLLKGSFHQSKCQLLCLQGIPNATCSRYGLAGQLCAPGAAARTKRGGSKEQGDRTSLCVTVCIIDR